MGPAIGQSSSQASPALGVCVCSRSARAGGGVTFQPKEPTMARRFLVLMLLAGSLAAPGVQAQPAPAAPAAPKADAVDPKAVQALKDMGAYLQSLKRFHVRTEVTGERVLADGQKLQRSATASLDVARPDKLRAAMGTANGRRVIVHDGKSVTLYTPGQKYYSTVDLTATVGELVNR